jgi:hypothetical protein
MRKIDNLVDFMRMKRSAVKAGLKMTPEEVYNF